MTTDAGVTEEEARARAYGRIPAALGSLHDIVDQYVRPVAAANASLVHHLVNVRDNGSVLAAPLDVLAQLAQLAQSQRSAVILFEHHPSLPVDAPIRALQEGVEAFFGLASTVHVYASGPGQGALAPHTDPYDTVVLHLRGAAKHWRVCR